MALHLARMMGTGECPHEALDATAMVVRDSKRRGSGWLAGYVDIGWSSRLGWHEDFKVRLAVSPEGVITGFGFTSASTAEQPLAETFFNARACSEARLPSVGFATRGCDVDDKGFEGGQKPPAVARTLWGANHPSARNATVVSEAGSSA